MVRLLQRRLLRSGDSEVTSGEYRLSTPLAPHGWRVLLPPPAGSAEALGQTLSAALPRTVTVLSRDAAGTHWSAVAYENGAESERASGAVRAAPLRLWERLPGARPPLPGDAAWAAARGLPIRAVSLWSPREAARLPNIDYDAVAQLDQRRLLTEDAPRFYRFVLDPPAPPAPGAGNDIISRG